MRKIKLTNFIFLTVLTAILFSAGCSGTDAIPEEAKTSEEKVIKYRATSRIMQNAEFGGNVPEDQEFNGGESSQSYAVEFTQENLEADEPGYKKADITITAVKAKSIIKDNLVLDYDSKTAKEANPLSKLIGMTYTITVKPNGQVAEIEGNKQLQSKFKAASFASQTAAKLLSDEAIERRHGSAAYPPEKKLVTVQTGDTWSSYATFDFGTMGAKALEKKFKVKEIEKKNGAKVAVVEMKGLPTGKMAEELHEKQKAGLSDMFQSETDFTGSLIIELQTGMIETYSENLESSWTIIVPGPAETVDEQPAYLKMTAEKDFELKKI